MAGQLKTELTLKDKNFSAKLNSACKKAQNQLQSVSQASGLLGKSIGGTAGQISGLIGGFSKMAGPMAAATASIAAIGAGLKSVVENSAKFEVALDHLQSLTGLTADQMENVKGQILNTAAAIHVAASELADTYGVIGSKMPELLQNTKALDEVARSAKTLSSAGLMELQEAVESLTGIMNQMGAKWWEANNYINVLAAGSKNGAGNIQYLSEAFNKAGSAISTAGLSVEQGTAVIEALAKKIPDAAVAGTRLNKVLLTLATSSNDNLNPQIVGLEDALKNLNKMSGNTTAMVKMFGTANYNAAMILAQEADNIIALTDAVTGTNEAEKQADINTQNLQSQVNKLKASWENLTSAFSESIGVLSTLVSWLDQAVQGWIALIGARERYEGVDTSVRDANEEQRKFYENKRKGNKKQPSLQDKKLANDDLIKDNLAQLEVAEKKLQNLYTERAKKVDDILKKHPNANLENWAELKRFDDQILLAQKTRDALKEEDTRLKGIYTTDNTKKPTAPTSPTPKPTKGGSTKGNEIPTMKNSLEDYEKQLRTLQEKYRKGLIDRETFERDSKNLEKLIKDKKIELYPEFDPNGLNALQEELRQLQQDQASGKIKLSADEYRKQVKDLEDKIKAKEIEIGVKLPESQLQKLETQLQQLQEDQLSSKINLDGEEYKKQVKDLEQQIESEKIRLGISLSKDDLDKELKETLADFRKKSSFEIAVGIEPPKSDEDRLSFIEQQMDENDALIEQLKKLQEEYKKLGEAGAEGYQNVSAKIAEVEAEQTKLGGEAKTTDGVIKQTNKMSTGFSRAGEAVGAFGDVMSSLSFDSPELNVAGTIAQAIAQIALGAGQAIAQAGEMGPWAWVAFGLTAMAQLAAMVSQLHSITGYATGGIVGGGRSIGDKNLVAVNSGEMILNKGQQGRLWNMINSNSTIGNSSQMTGNVEFKLRGADLYGSFKNYKTLAKKQ